MSQEEFDLSLAEELLLDELNYQIRWVKREMRRALASISEDIHDAEDRMKWVPSSDPGTVNSIRSQCRSEIRVLKAEYRNTIDRAHARVRELRMQRRKIEIELEETRRLGLVVREDAQR